MAECHAFYEHYLGKCDSCNAKPLVRIIEGDVVDGEECDVCKRRLCNNCLDADIEKNGPWESRWHGSLTCGSCQALLPPHNIETCWSCAVTNITIQQTMAVIDERERKIKKEPAWTRMLKGVFTPEAAEAIAAAYPSAPALVAACNTSQKRTADDIDPIAEIPLPSGKRLGIIGAYHVRQHFMS